MADSDYEQTIVPNKTKGKDYQIPCSRCLTHTRHIVIQSVDVSGIWLPGSIHFTDQYQIVQCQGCDTLAFRKNSTNSEDFYTVENPDGSTENIYEEHIDIFPSRIARRTRVKRYWLLPPQVSRMYDETHSALSNKLNTLGIVGIRVLVESVCMEKQATGNNLKEKIDNLVSKGILTESGATILHSLRDLGNESAHKMKSQDEESIDLAMDVVENMLQSVYILPEASKRQKILKENGGI